MCATCGFPAAPGHWTEAGWGATPHERLRGRFRRAAILQAVLPAYGLSAYDSISTPGLVIGDLAGGQTIAADLAELWAGAETLGGRAVDPLDPRFIGSPD